MSSGSRRYYDMAIVFSCPHCQELYRLRDELAGKQAKCKNPDCRQLITIPHPVTVPEDALEEAALAALTEQPTQAEAPPAEQVIAMTCTYCAHNFTVPLAMGGKNTLCPNPECRQRLRVPEPKDTKAEDWRQAKTKLPSLAKEAQQKLEGVQDAGDTRMVSGKALQEAGAIEVEYEPRPLKQKILFGLLSAAALGSIVFGVVYWMRSGQQEEEDRLMAEARQELDQTRNELLPTEAGFYSALLNAAAAEYALRKNIPEMLKQAHELLGNARDELRKAPVGPCRNVIGGELALLVIAFGGTEDQVREQIRLRWQPETGNQIVRVNEKTVAVHTELRQTLALLSAADFEFKLTLTRRLTRELMSKGQATLAAELIPLALFNDGERDEARATIALEIYRLDKASALPREIAEELKNQFAGNVKGSYPTVHTLFTVMGIDRKPPLIPPLPPTGPVNDATCLAYVGNRLLEGKMDEALQVAQRAQRSDIRLKALLLCGEWGSNPAAVLDAVPAVLGAIPGRRDGSQAHILRLVQFAAVAGRHDLTSTLCNAINDDSLREWARGEAVRQRIAASAEAKADPKWVEVPEIAEKLRAGHAWGLLWVARHNAKLSGNRAEEKEVTADWKPAPIHPFALAGIALGLQDR